MSDDPTGVATTGGTDGDPDGWTPGFLVAIREDRRRRLLALALAALVGLGAAWIHWVGLFFAGALVGVVSRTVPRAAAAGLGVGVLVLVVHLAAAPVVSPAAFAAFRPVSLLTVAAGLLAPLWGSLVRGVV